MTLRDSYRLNNLDAGPNNADESANIVLQVLCGIAFDHGRLQGELEDLAYIDWLQQVFRNYRKNNPR